MPNLPTHRVKEPVKAHDPGACRDRRRDRRRASPFGVRFAEMPPRSSASSPHYVGAYMLRRHERPDINPASKSPFWRFLRVLCRAGAVACIDPDRRRRRNPLFFLPERHTGHANAEGLADRGSVRADPPCGAAAELRRGLKAPPAGGA